MSGTRLPSYKPKPGTSGDRLRRLNESPDVNRWTEQCREFPRTPHDWNRPVCSNPPHPNAFPYQPYPASVLPYHRYDERHFVPRINPDPQGYSRMEQGPSVQESLHLPTQPLTEREPYRTYSPSRRYHIPRESMQFVRHEPFRPYDWYPGHPAEPGRWERNSPIVDHRPAHQSSHRHNDSNNHDHIRRNGREDTRSSSQYSRFHRFSSEERQGTHSHISSPKRELHHSQPARSKSSTYHRYDHRRSSKEREKSSSKRRSTGSAHKEVPGPPGVDSVRFQDDTTPLNIQEEMERLKSSYVQCTQHGNMYKRIMHSDSTVEATEKLKNLFDRFEKQLANRHKALWKPNLQTVPPEPLPDASPSHIFNLNKFVLVTSEALRSCDSSVVLTRHQRVKGLKYAKKLLDAAKRHKMSIEEFIDNTQPTMPNYCLTKLKQILEEGETALEANVNEEPHDEAGQLINAIRKLKAHPDRLHADLWYNEPLQVNDGPLCRCGAEGRTKGIRHNMYPGEGSPPSCQQMMNNIGKLHHYRVMVGPAVNFMSSAPTTIMHNDHEYMFEGYSLFSHEPLSSFPFCDIIRFHIHYTIYLIEETPPENFCMKGLDLFNDYLFREILELYDWHAKDKSYPENTESENFQKFRFYPRFVRTLPDNGKEFLSLCKVLEYLLEMDQPLVPESDLNFVMECKHEEWLDYSSKVRGMIVTYPGKKPSSLRVDQLDRYDRTPVESRGTPSHPVDSRYPMIVHFGVRPANLSYAGDPAYLRISRAYLKLRHLVANSPRVKASDRKKLKDRENVILKLRREKNLQREVTVELSSKGFRRTGIYSDMCQHALILPVLTHHLRYYLCLSTLEDRLGYHFKEKKWLNHAMNHPSCRMNFGLNPDHVRNALSNCGLRMPRYGDSSIHFKYTRKRGIITLIHIMARLGQQRPVLSPIEHNERLEFLGDAVVGYLTSVHLFLMFPDLSEGALTTFRTVLVNNQHLATLAERLQLDEYMLCSHGPDLCRKADLRHAMANCFEALMGAIFMEAGLDTAQKLFGKFLWETTELQDVWENLPLHPLQTEEPTSDRHCISGIPLLQKLTKFEDSIGVQFNHIRLLAKSFTWRNVHENILTHGHNQRLEFLGDSVCNLVASAYLFKFYPTHHEGHLTLLRATMVNGRTQSLIAKELGMPEYVICNLGSDNAGRIPEWREKNLADLLEAFVAALFLDKGLKYVEGFMRVCFFPRLKEFILTREWNDPKSSLQQCCLTLRQEGKEPELPTYKISKQSGPSHARRYEVSVCFQGAEIGRGTGDSIQRAERNAATTALSEYNFPQLEWQRRFVAEKHGLPYTPRRNLKSLDDEPVSDDPNGKTRCINGGDLLMYGNPITDDDLKGFASRDRAPPCRSSNDDNDGPSPPKRRKLSDSEHAE